MQCKDFPLNHQGVTIGAVVPARDKQDASGRCDVHGVSFRFTTTGVTVGLVVARDEQRACAAAEERTVYYVRRFVHLRLPLRGVTVVRWRDDDEQQRAPATVAAPRLAPARQNGARSATKNEVPMMHVYGMASETEERRVYDVREARRAVRSRLPNQPYNCHRVDPLSKKTA